MILSSVHPCGEPARLSRCVLELLLVVRAGALTEEAERGAGEDGAEIASMEGHHRRQKTVTSCNCTTEWGLVGVEMDGWGRRIFLSWGARLLPLLRPHLTIDSLSALYTSASPPQLSGVGEDGAKGRGERRRGEGRCACVIGRGGRGSE
jgi:hypothetical protein